MRGFDRDRDCVWFDRDCGNAFWGRWRAQGWDLFDAFEEPHLASACKDGALGWSGFFLDGALWWCFFGRGTLVVGFFGRGTLVVGLFGRAT